MGLGGGFEYGTVKSMKISVMIPVYKEPELLGDIIRKISADNYPDKEIMVAVDGDSTSKIEDVLDKYRGKIRIFYNNGRWGKVNTLNRLSDEARGEAFLFLDNDIKLPDDIDFLDKVSRELTKSDIVELPKEAIVTNLFSKIVSYDFLGAAVMCFIVARTFETNFFLNGAAFAIKRKTFEDLERFPRVINEDWQLMMKAFRIKKRYSFPPDLKVGTVAPTNFTEWVEQRKRWVLGIKSWLTEIMQGLKKYIGGMPIILSMILLFSIPNLVALALWKFKFFSTALPALILLFQHLCGNFGLPSFVYSLLMMLILLQGVGPFLVSLSISTAVFFIFSRILKFRFNIFEFLLYSTIYFPILALVYVVYGIILSPLSKPKIDWAC
ncbi:MAG TPA: hypothetical protein DCX95_04590 [Elusimicrobia bacterium]|nr:hypothetical protein [Elusimicrobiota bacterium]